MDNAMNMYYVNVCLLPVVTRQQMLPCNATIQLTGATPTVYALEFVSGLEGSQIQPTASGSDSPSGASQVPFTVNCPVTFQSRPGQKLRISMYSFGGQHHDDQLGNVRPTAADVLPLQLPQTSLTSPPNRQQQQQHGEHAACPATLNVIDGQTVSQVPLFIGDICRLPRLRERHLHTTNGTTAHVYITDEQTSNKQFPSAYRRWNFILKLEGTALLIFGH
jgi:hypothetical protein